ncbi:MAG: transposase [Candidatus Paceibacterota bacterium]
MLRKDPFITGEYYHIYNRGIDKRVILKTKGDYERLMILLYLSNSNISFRLDDIINRQHKTLVEVFFLNRDEQLVSIGAWCLMPNHFHILIKQEVDGGITKFMKKLGTAYSMFFNVKYQRQGALFGGPFKSKLIGNNDNYIRQLFAYIHLNPLEIQFPEWEKEINQRSSMMKNFLESYRYSSYQDYIGIGREESNILNKKNFPDFFQKENSFKEFVEGYFIKVF